MIPSLLFSNLGPQLGSTTLHFFPTKPLSVSLPAGACVMSITGSDPLNQPSNRVYIPSAGRKHWGYGWPRIQTQNLSDESLAPYRSELSGQPYLHSQASIENPGLGPHELQSTGWAACAARKANGDRSLLCWRNPREISAANPQKNLRNRLDFAAQAFARHVNDYFPAGWGSCSCVQSGHEMIREQLELLLGKRSLAWK